MRVQPVRIRKFTEALRSGAASLPSLLEALCDRIDACEPELHALLPEPDRRARLLREAAELEARHPDPAERPALYGVPVGIKDIIRVDGFPTRCGSELPAELFAGPEAACVRALRAAGALVLGKTVTTEFAYFEPGPARNPWNPEHTPGGSSSGSAAAVAAGYCPAALGSQTVGSVIRPAAFCGVVGFKPSYGLLSLEGVIPYAPSLDHLGFFTAAAGEGELELLLSALGSDLATDPINGAALGIAEGPYLRQASPEARELFERQVAHLERRGLRVRRVPALPDVAAVNEAINTVAAAEMAAVHRDWFGVHPERYRPRTASWIRAGQAIPPAAVETAREGRPALRARLAALMKEHEIDAWICPAAASPAPRGLASTGDPCMNGPWTYAGLPAVTLPAGRFRCGLPAGLQCVGGWMRDNWLGAFAGRLEAELAGFE